MATDQNKQLVKRFFDEVMNGKKLNVIEQIVAPNFVNHGIPDTKPGPAGFKEAVQRFTTGFPDLKLTVENIIAEGDLVATFGYCTGTNTGSFMGNAPTGKQARINFVDFWKVQNGKLVENWVQMDMVGVLVQLGLMPAPETA